MSIGRGGKPQNVLVTLIRDGFGEPWGLRLVGGADLGKPLVVTRVQASTPAEGHLKVGDIIKKIGEYDARDLRHEDAQSLFKNAGNTISLAVLREQQHSGHVNNAYGTNYVSSKPPVVGGVATPFVAAGITNAPSLPKSIPASLKEPERCASPVVFPPPLPLTPGLLDGNPYAPTVKSNFGNVAGGMGDDIDIITNQPYRTTPLVLPGAKVRKDPVPTASYLRHHPNPSFRAPPSHYDTTAEVLMKQKVADTVLQRVVGEDAAGKQVFHKQFNSPIGLYSDQNIVETIQAQTGVTPNARVRASTLNPRNQAHVSLKKTVSYDPSKSETFKALQEAELGDSVQEVTVPVQPRVFSPTKNFAANKGVPVKKPASPQQVNYLNALGNSDDTIHQSGSFKRLMNSVLGESEF